MAYQCFKTKVEDGSSPMLAIRSYYITELNLAADRQTWRASQSTTGAKKQLSLEWFLGWSTTAAVKVPSDGKLDQGSNGW
jgi:hypothetical protein